MKNSKTLSWLPGVFALLFFAFAPPKKFTTAYKLNTDQSTLNWTGRKVTGEHTGTIKISEGSIFHNGKNLTGGRFVIDMNSIACTDIADETYNGKLVGHLKSDDFFAVEKFPKAVLNITSITYKGKNVYELGGDLTIKGITKSIKFPAAVSADGKALDAKAKITVDRSAYDVRYGSTSFFDNLGDKAIYNDFDLEVNLVASRSDS